MGDRTQITVVRDKPSLIIQGCGIPGWPRRWAKLGRPAIKNPMQKRKLGP
jgi:hypothetical protein